MHSFEYEHHKGLYQTNTPYALTFSRSTLSRAFSLMTRFIKICRFHSGSTFTSSSCNDWTFPSWRPSLVSFWFLYPIGWPLMPFLTVVFVCSSLDSLIAWLEVVALFDKESTFTITLQSSWFVTFALNSTDVDSKGPLRWEISLLASFSFKSTCSFGFNDSLPCRKIKEWLWRQSN